MLSSTSLILSRDFSESNRRLTDLYTGIGGFFTEAC